MQYFRLVNDRLRTHARALYAAVDEQLAVATVELYTKRGFRGRELQQRVADNTPQSIGGLEEVLNEIYMAGMELEGPEVSRKQARKSAQDFGVDLARLQMNGVLKRGAARLEGAGTTRAQSQAIDGILADLADTMQKFDHLQVSEVPRYRATVKDSYLGELRELYESVASAQPPPTGLRSIFKRAQPSPAVHLLRERIQDTAVLETSLADSKEVMEATHEAQIQGQTLPLLERVQQFYLGALQTVARTTRYQSISRHHFYETPVFGQDRTITTLDHTEFDRAARAAAGQGLDAPFELAASSTASSVPALRRRDVSPMHTYDVVEVTPASFVESVDTQPIPVISAQYKPSAQYFSL